MKEILLVGENISFLRALSFELGRSKINVRIVDEQKALMAFLAQAEAQPAMAIFDHVEPMDVFLLNPRNHGYAGPVVLLIDYEPSDELRESLRPTHILIRPALIRSVAEEISILLEAP